MPTRLYIILAIGVSMLIFLIYELVTKKAYGTWREKGGIGQRHRARALNSRWHTRSDNSRMYWKLVANHGIISVVAIAYFIVEFLK